MVTVIFFVHEVFEFLNDCRVPSHYYKYICRTAISMNIYIIITIIILHNIYNNMHRKFAINRTANQFLLDCIPTKGYSIVPLGPLVRVFIFFEWRKIVGGFVSFIHFTGHGQHNECRNENIIHQKFQHFHLLSFGKLIALSEKFLFPCILFSVRPSGLMSWVDLEKFSTGLLTF